MFAEYTLLVSKARQAGNPANVGILDMLLEALAKAHDSKSKVGGKSPKAKQMACTPIQWLSTFKEQYTRDEPQTRFDMIAFSQRCSIFMEEVRKQVSDPLKSPQDVSETMHPHLVTNYILSDSAAKLDAGDSASQTLLPIVASAIKNTIANHGDKLSTEATSRSSSSLSTAHKPRYEPTWKFRAIGYERVFTVLVRECIGPAQNWHFEDNALAAAISVPNGKVKTYRTLTRVHDTCEGWEWHVISTMPDAQAAEAIRLLVEDLRTWVKTGLKSDSMPVRLVLLLATGLEGGTDKESLKRAPQWLRKAVSAPL